MKANYQIKASLAGIVLLVLSSAYLIYREGQRRLDALVFNAEGPFLKQQNKPQSPSKKCAQAGRQTMQQ